MTQKDESPRLYLGTIFVGNPIGQIHVSVAASTPGDALELLNRFAVVAKYTVLDTRIDIGCLISEETVLQMETNKS